MKGSLFDVYSGQKACFFRLTVTKIINCRVFLSLFLVSKRIQIKSACDCELFLIRLNLISKCVFIFVYCGHIVAINVTDREKNTEKDRVKKYCVNQLTNTWTSLNVSLSLAHSISNKLFFPYDLTFQYLILSVGSSNKRTVIKTLCYITINIELSWKRLRLFVCVQ